MPDLLAALDVFMQERRRCGELDGVEEGRAWMGCSCGAGIAHSVGRRNWNDQEGPGGPKKMSPQLVGTYDWRDSI